MLNVDNYYLHAFPEESGLRSQDRLSDESALVGLLTVLSSGSVMKFNNIS